MFQERHTAANKSYRIPISGTPRTSLPKRNLIRTERSVAAAGQPSRVPRAAATVARFYMQHVLYMQHVVWLLESLYMLVDPV